MQKVLASVVFLVVVLALVAFAWLRAGPAPTEPAAAERSAPAGSSTPTVAPITAPAASPARAVQTPAPEPPAEAPEPAAAAPLAADRATLVVFVREGARSVLQGTVEVQDEKEVTLATAEVSAADGAARFEDLAPGKVVLRVDDLDAELLPPRIQAKQHDNIEVTLVPGPNEATLEVERRAFVFGYVRDVDGQPVREELFLRFSSHGPWERQVPSVDLRTLEGYYEGHLYPGEWFSDVMGAMTDVGLRELSHRVARPKPVMGYHQLGPGSVTQIDFQCLSGSSTLLGQVLDDESKPFEKLPVYVERYGQLQDPDTGESLAPRQGVCRVTTDDNGRFSIEGLIPGRYRVAVESGAYTPMMRPEERRVGQVAQAKLVDVTDDAVVEVEFRLRRFRPTHFRAQIEVDPAWAMSHRLWGRLPSAVVVLGPNDWRPKERRERLYPSEKGLDFYLDLEGGTAYVELTLGGVTKVHPLFADGSEPGPFVIEFP